MKYVRQVQPGDLEFLAENLRPCDVEEVRAIGKEPLQALVDGYTTDKYVRIQQSPEAVPVGIFGANWEPEHDVATIWMLATPSIELYPITFLRQCAKEIENVFEISGKSLLWNRTYAENTLHHTWLKWCGAKFLSCAPVGIHGEAFYEFVIMRKHHV